jgi:hypothetical protein
LSGIITLDEGLALIAAPSVLGGNARASIILTNSSRVPGPNSNKSPMEAGGEKTFTTWPT